jgi:nucleotide-binding universal stress UspA family protein
LLASDAEVVSIPATSVGAGLHDVADRRGADLIVVGSCDRFCGRRIFAGDDRAPFCTVLPLLSR